MFRNVRRDSSAMPRSVASLSLDTSLLKPGMRLAVGLSGGADSVALLRALAARSAELGLVLHAAHLHHGLRGEEADGDLAFARELAAALGLPFHEARVDVAAEAEADPAAGKAAETIEEAARRLRYAWFRQLMAAGRSGRRGHRPHARRPGGDGAGEVSARRVDGGAWRASRRGSNLPKARFCARCWARRARRLRPISAALGQAWREDSSNRHLTFTRNRIRHELLPLLEGWNPRLREHLAQMAELARDEEAWWQAELARLAPQILLPGRAGAGRWARGRRCGSACLSST